MNIGKENLPQAGLPPWSAISQAMAMADMPAVAALGYIDDYRRTSDKKFLVTAIVFLMRSRYQWQKEIQLVAENGAGKYGTDSWRNSRNTELFVEDRIHAACRHILLALEKPSAMDDSGAHPLSHAIVNLAIVHELARDLR